MKRRTPLKPRRQPQQERSRQLREGILAASLRVLRTSGALHFTTLRVAEAAGISVGSLYQYFPNKQALLFALHEAAVTAAWAEVQRILDEPGLPSRAKLFRIARLRFRAESSEVAARGTLLQDIEIYFADQPEHRALPEPALAGFTDFLAAVLPRRTPASALARSARFLVTVLEGVGRSVAAQKLPRATVDRFARDCAEMLATQLGIP